MPKIKENGYKIKENQAGIEIKDLSTLQAMLNALGFSVSDSLGNYGDSTLYAVKKFQHKVLNSAATGIVDKKLFDKVKRFYTDSKKYDSDNELVLNGRLIGHKNQSGISGVSVKVFDSDLYTDDDFLGEADSDENGWFSIVLDLNKAKEKHPDLYFKLHRGAEYLKSTKDKPFLNYQKTDKPVIIEVDYPEKQIRLSTPSPALHLFQKNLQKRGFLKKYLTGLLDDKTFQGYKKYVKAFQEEDKTGEGKHRATVTFRNKKTKEEQRGVLVKIEKVDNDKISIPLQSHVSDASGKVKISYEVKKKLPKKYKVSLKIKVFDPRNLNKPIKTLNQPMAFEGDMYFSMSADIAESAPAICIDIAGTPKQTANELIIDNVNIEALPTAANDNQPVALRIMDDHGYVEDGEHELWINLFKYATSTDLAARVSFPESRFGDGPSKVTVLAAGRAGNFTFKAYDKEGGLLCTEQHDTGLESKEHVLDGGKIRHIDITGYHIALLQVCYEGAAASSSATIAEAAAGSIISTPCECDPCTSALSPSAYYIDLLGFTTDTFKVGTAWLEDRLRQPLSSVLLNCESVEDRKFYIAFANEALINFIAERRNLPWRGLATSDIDAIYEEFKSLPTDVLDLFDWVMNHRGWSWAVVTSDGLDAIYEEFHHYVTEVGLAPVVLYEAFKDILLELGTSVDSVNAVSGDAVAQSDLLSMLGLEDIDLAYLSKSDNEVVYSDMQRGFELLYKSKSTLLLQSYRNNVKQEQYAIKLEELLALMDSGDASAPASEAAAHNAAETFAENQATLAEPALWTQAENDANEQTAEAVERIERKYLPLIRTNLLFIAHNEARRNHYGLPVINSGEALGDYLNIELSTGICQKITCLGFLIVVLQSLISSFKLGHEDFAPVAANLNVKRWVWMKSYGIWHAIQSIFLYPSNFVFPSIRRIDNGWAGRGWSEFFDGMTEYIDEQARFNLSSAQGALDYLSDRIKDIEGVEVSHMVETRDHLYMFCCNTTHETTRLYYSRIDRNGEWTGWMNIDLLGYTLRKSSIDNRCIQDVVVLDERVYIFYLVREDYQAMFAAVDANGLSIAPVPLTDKYVDNVCAVVIRPRIIPQNTVPEGRILAFYPNPDQPSSASSTDYVPQEYLVTAVKDDAEELSDAKLLIPAGASLISVASFSGLSNHIANDVLKNTHAVWTPGITVYSPVLFAIRTGANYLGVYGNQHADDQIWQRFNSDNATFNLIYEPNWQNLVLYENGPDIGAMNAKLLPRWVGSSAADIGTSFQFWFFNGASKIYKLNASLNRRPDINVYPPVDNVKIDSVSLFNNRLFLHNEGYLIERSNSGSLQNIGQVVLKPPDIFFPLEVNIQKRRGSIGTGTEPIITENGRRQLKVVQARKFSQFTTSGFAKEYLAELFLHAPLYIAELFNEDERFEDANSVLSVVFQPFISEQEHLQDQTFVQNTIDVYWPEEVSLAPETRSHRFIYYGFFEEDDTNPQLEYRGTDAFLDDPVNPHTLADHRPLTYARNAVQSTVDNLLDWADSEFSRDAPESVPLAREKYEDVEKILYFPDLPKDLCAVGYSSLTLPAEALDGGAGQVRTQAITRGFCIPPNPINEAFKYRVESNLQKIRSCRNIAGVKRALSSYAAAVDPVALVEAAAAGAELDDFVPSQPPPLYRYSILYERARQLIQIATQYEAHFLSIIEKYDAAIYSVDKARNDLRLSNENVSLRGLHIRRANQSVKQAELQLERTQISYDYYNELIEEGYSTLEEVAIGVMIATAAGQAVAAGVSAYYQQYQAAAQWGAAALQSTTSILQTYAAFERRAQEWGYQLDLASKDIDISNQGINIVKTELDIAEKEKSIAELNSQFARDAVEFLTVKQFANADLYRWMKKELRKLYRKQLNMAHASARAAQQALAFELQEPLSIVGYQYGDIRRENLLGAEKLSYDLEKLEQHRFTQAERRREITQTISLASAMPGEFGRFKQTGILEFATPSELFDRYYPGQHQRLIKSVEVSVIALIPPTSGIHATLSNHGISRVMTGEPFTEANIVQRTPESVSLSSPVDASGLFKLRLEDPMLLPFEGSGVDSSWTFEMSPATNRFNFHTIVDVLMKIRYTAREDWGYKQKVIAKLREEYSNTVAASAKSNYPDTWYDFHNPRYSGGLTPYSLVMDISSNQFPSNERNLKIRNVMIAGIMDQVIPVPINLIFKPESGVQIRADNKVLAGETGSVKLTEFTNKAPYGQWTVEFDTTADDTVYTDFFSGSTVLNGNLVIDTERYKDLLLIIEYGAELAF